MSFIISSYVFYVSITIPKTEAPEAREFRHYVSAVRC
jgi:hypothetical protein